MYAGAMFAYLLYARIMYAFLPISTPIFFSIYVPSVHSSPVDSILIPLATHPPQSSTSQICSVEQTIARVRLALALKLVLRRTQRDKP